MNVGDKVVYGNFAGTFRQVVKDRCVIELAVPMKDGATTVLAPLNEVEVVRSVQGTQSKSRSRSRSSVRSTKRK